MANWLLFDKIDTWDFVILEGFQYDEVPDAHIAQALADQANLLNVDETLDWEDDQWLAEQQAIPQERKHAYRVAALVQALLSGDRLRNTISMDTFCVGNCCSCVSNGHHRIRALQYLGVPAGPFDLSGQMDPLEELVRLAGTVCPEKFAKYFLPSLLMPTEDDIEATLGSKQ